MEHPHICNEYTKVADDLCVHQLCGKTFEEQQELLLNHNNKIVIQDSILYFTVKSSNCSFRMLLNPKKCSFQIGEKSMNYIFYTLEEVTQALERNFKHPCYEESILTSEGKTKLIKEEITEKNICMFCLSNKEKIYELP